MKKTLLVVSLILLASAAHAQQTESLSYYLQPGNHPLLHFPRIHYIGTDTFTLTGLAERFTSPFGTTYLDSLELAYSLPHFVDVPQNDYAVYVMGSTLDSTGQYLIADTSNMLFRYQHHPSVSDTNHGVWLRLSVPHIVVDTAFFVVFVITDSNSSDIEFGIGMDSVTFDARQPVDDNLDRCREYGAGSQQFYVAGNHFTDLASNSVYWYSNAMFIAHVSDTKSDVAQLSPSGFSLHTPFPDPAFQSITFNYSLPVTEPVEIQLFDEAGRLMQPPTDVVQSKGAHVQPIDISSLTIGSYHYRIIAGHESFSGKFNVLH
ncbi:MAG TPA: T9SS type A sorting domain-containing protein [Candidatus Kapabacteria bacterium]|nr:T9SS type A sorting domain-containing protein [Candidatus Kapabacteria bacterium]